MERDNVRDGQRKPRKEIEMTVESVDGLNTSSQNCREKKILDNKYQAKVNKVLIVDSVALVDDKDKTETFAKKYR